MAPRHTSLSEGIRVPGATSCIITRQCERMIGISPPGVLHTVTCVSPRLSVAYVAMFSFNPTRSGIVTIVGATGFGGDPAGPCGPASPVAPFAPCAPGSPGDPFGPGDPVAPT